MRLHVHCFGTVAMAPSTPKETKKTITMTPKQIVHHRRPGPEHAELNQCSRLRGHAFPIDLGAMASGGQCPIRRSRSPPGGPADFEQGRFHPDELAVFLHKGKEVFLRRH
jgi:hypothetical protein